MSSSDQKKSRKKKNELISSFIDKKETNEIGEPSSKRNKLNEESNNNDDSLKLFKKVKSCSSTSSSSKKTVVSEFFNKPSTSKQAATVTKKPQSKTKKSTKKTKSHPDIRQVLNKQDKLLYGAINDSCVDEGVDPYEMQLAIALSESLKDTKKEKHEGKNFENPFSSTGKIQSVNTVLEHYGFKGKRTYTDYEIGMIVNQKPTKRSKYTKVPTILTQTTNNKRDELIRNRVDDVLNSILFADLETKTYPKTYPQVYSPYLLELYDNYRTVFGQSSTENMIFSDFFVSDLFEETNVKAGHLLKDWNSIIGRDPSPEKVKRKSLNEEKPLEIKAPESPPKRKSFNSSCSDIFDGVESFTLDELADDPLCSQVENSRDVNDELNLLHEKLSQTVAVSKIIVNDEMQTENSDVTEEYIYSPKGQQEPDEEIFDLTQYNIPSQEMLEEIIKSNSEIYDLTQLESSGDALKHENSNDYFDLTQRNSPEKLELISTKSSFDENEIICISDEEINYSIHRFQKNNSSNSLSQSEGSNEIMEIDNIAEQSLLEVIPIDDNFKINNSVSELLLNFTENRLSNSFTRKNKSTKFMENECNNDSIADIMKKYGIVQSPSIRKSFTKMQSESNLEKYSQDSVHSISSNEDMEINNGSADNDLTIINDVSSQNSSQSPKMNDSINKSLANILNSPAVPQNAIKQKPRKSLGIVLNKKYVIDTESLFIEPDYSSMTPHELKLQLFKYGIRPLPVKKAVELLTHIYNQLHPKIRVATDEEMDINDSRREMNITDIASNIGMHGEDDEFVFQLDCAGILDDEEYILPKMKKSKTPTCLIPLHISFYNMIRSNDLLQKYILEFRPLDLDQIYKHFRKFDLTYQLNDIIGFLDKRCITFKTKEQSYSKKHERKKQKRTQKSQ